MKAFVLCFLLMLASCTPQKRWEEGKLKVLCTIAMIQDLAAQIGGEHADVRTLICGELDPHSYELVKGDDEKFAEADLIFYNGLGLEHGLSMRQLLETCSQAMAVSQGLEERDILYYDGVVDPHIWMDISLFAKTINPMVAAFCERDPAHASYYRVRGIELKNELLAADKQIMQLFAALPQEHRYLVTSHDAFRYFARHYLAQDGSDWEMRCKAPEGLAPDSRLSLADLAAILSHVEAYSVYVLFPESCVSPQALNKLVSAASKKGIELRLCKQSLYSDTMGQASTYLEMVRHNATVIAQELEAR